MKIYLNKLKKTAQIFKVILNHKENGIHRIHLATVNRSQSNESAVSLLLRYKFISEVKRKNSFDRTIGYLYPIKTLEDYQEFFKFDVQTGERIT